MSSSTKKKEAYETQNSPHFLLFLKTTINCTQIMKILIIKEVSSQLLALQKYERAPTQNEITLKGSEIECAKKKKLKSYFTQSFKSHPVFF